MDTKLLSNKYFTHTRLNRKQLRILLLIIAIIVITGVSILLALLSGNIYKNSTADKSQQELCRISSYFTEEIRQCQNVSDIRTGTLGGKTPALVIPFDNDTKEIWFFEYDGNLKKAKIQTGKKVSPASGEIVMNVKSIDFHLIHADLLEISITTNTDKSSTVNLQLAGKRGEINE